jgi:hypothetical protein
MQIDQRHVTTVNLHDGRVRDFVLLKDGRGYKLSSVSKDDVVNLLLSPTDLQKLRQEIAKPDVKDVRTEAHVCRPEPVGHFILNRKESAVASQPDERTAAPEPYVFQWSTLDWLSFN